MIDPPDTAPLAPFAPRELPRCADCERLLEREFRALADRWHEETCYLSSPSDIRGHPSYQAIIARGDEFLPHILRDLRDHGGDWYGALHAITGAWPAPKEAAGRFRLLRAAWLQWGREHGYLV